VGYYLTLLRSVFTMRSVAKIEMRPANVTLIKLRATSPDL